MVLLGNYVNLGEKMLEKIIESPSIQHRPGIETESSHLADRKKNKLHNSQGIGAGYSEVLASEVENHFYYSEDYSGPR